MLVNVVFASSNKNYGGLLSSSCGGLKGPSGPKVILPDERTDGRTTFFRELDELGTGELWLLVVLMHIGRSFEEYLVFLELYFAQHLFNV